MGNIKTLLKSQNENNSLLNDIKTGIYIWKLDDNQFFPSDHLLHILGYEHKEAEFSHYEAWRSIWHPDDVTIVDEIRSSAIKNYKKEYHLLHRLRHNDGIYRYYKTNAMIVYENDKPKFIIGSTNNFEKLSKIIVDFEIEQAIYKNFLKATEASTWIWHIQTGETIFDEHWAHMLGYTLDELEPVSIKTWDKLLYHEDIDLAHRNLNHALATDSPYHSTFRMVHKNGNLVYISDNGLVIQRDKVGKPLLMIGTHIDITKFKELENRLIENQKLYKHFVESSYDIIYQIDKHKRFMFISNAFELLLGYHTNDILNQDITRFIHEDDLPMLNQFFECLSQSYKRHEIKEFRVFNYLNQVRYFKTNAIAIFDDNHEFIGITGTAVDITESKKMAEKLSYERDLFKKTLLSVSDGVISTDKAGIIRIVNQSALDLMGYKEIEIINQPLKTYFQTTSIKDASNIKIRTIYQKHIMLRRKSGKFVPVEINDSPILDKNGQIDGQVIVFRDVSAKIKQAKDIELLSYNDYLTGLYNRRYMENALTSYDKKMFLPLGIIMIDVNNLKRMNDKHGHLAGDELLKLIAKTIQTHTGFDDVVGRIGGDEFMVIMPNVDMFNLRRVKDKIFSDLFEVSLYGEKIEVSLGYATKLRLSEPIQSVVRKADDLMYQHKSTFK